jgi:Na+-driven multidrug efflux pump
LNNVRVSVALGGGDIVYAKKITLIGVAVVFPLLLALSVVVILNSRSLARIFSSDDEVSFLL